MNASTPENQKTIIRRLHYKDLEAIANLASEIDKLEENNSSVNMEREVEKLKQWYGLLKFLKLFPNPFEHELSIYVAEQLQELRGLIQVSPFNSTRSTWRVEWVLVNPKDREIELETGSKGIGSQLLRHCFEKIWEARTWLSEVNVNDKKTLTIYRQNGFQPLAEMTYWSLSTERLGQLAQHEPDLPNLLPVSNADAQLLCQLDSVSMPPLLRQVFDRHILDFKTSVFSIFINKLKQWLSQTEISSAYVFEPQRKAAIGYFKLEICKNGSHPHLAKLIVHPAYTWLYPQLLAKMAQIVQGFPSQSLELASADYQPEREEYLEKLGADQIQHTLLMSRSVWHKLREAKPLEALQLSEMLQGLKPSRTPIPSRMSWLNPIPSPVIKTPPNFSDSSSISSLPREENSSEEAPETPEEYGHHA